MNRDRFIVDIRAAKFGRKVSSLPPLEEGVTAVESIEVEEDGAYTWVMQLAGERQLPAVFGGRGGINLLPKLLPPIGDLKPLLEVLQTIKDLREKT